MIVYKLISVVVLVVCVYAQSDEVESVPQTRDKRTIGLVLRNVGDLFGFDVLRRPGILAGPEKSAALTAPLPPPGPGQLLTDSIRKSFSINIDWNKNKTAGAIPGPAPPAAPAPPPAPAPAPAPAPPPAPAPAPAPEPAPAPPPPPPPAPEPDHPDHPDKEEDLPPPPHKASAQLVVELKSSLPTTTPHTETKAKVYVELEGDVEEEEKSPDSVDDDDDKPKRIEIELPDYTNVEFKETKRDVTKQYENESREKFKQEFNNFWKATPWMMEHGYKFLVPQGPPVDILDIPREISKYEEFDLPKSNNVRSLKILHNVKVLHQPTTQNTNYHVLMPNLDTASSHYLPNEKSIKFFFEHDGKLIQAPSEIHAQLLQFFKKKFAIDAAVAKKAAIDAANAVGTDPNKLPYHHRPSVSDVYRNSGPKVHHHYESVSEKRPEIHNVHIEHPAINNERHFLKIKEVVFKDKSPKVYFTEQQEKVDEPEYVNVKAKIEDQPGYIDLGPHFDKHDLTAYLANAKPGQVVNIKIVEPIEKGNSDNEDEDESKVSEKKEPPREEKEEEEDEEDEDEEKQEEHEEQREESKDYPEKKVEKEEEKSPVPEYDNYDFFYKPESYFAKYKEEGDSPKKLDTKDEKEYLRQETREADYEDRESAHKPKIVYNNIKENFEVENLNDGHHQGDKESHAESQREASHQAKDDNPDGFYDNNYADYVKDIDSFINAHFKSNVEKYKIPADDDEKNEEKEEEESKVHNEREEESEDEQKAIDEDEEKNPEQSKAQEVRDDDEKEEEESKQNEEEEERDLPWVPKEEHIKHIQDTNEKEFENIFSQFGDGTEFEDFYKQFNRDKYGPAKLNLIQNTEESKYAYPKENDDRQQVYDATIVQPLYSGILHTGPLHELDKSTPLTVPFDHEYSASEKKGNVNTSQKTKRETSDYDEDFEDGPEGENNRFFAEESQYVPEEYTPEIPNFEIPEPVMPDFKKLEAKSYVDETSDKLSPKAHVMKREDGQKTTWITIEVPVTTVT